MCVCLCMHLCLCLSVCLRDAHSLMSGMCVSMPYLQDPPHSQLGYACVFKRCECAPGTDNYHVAAITCNRHHHHYDRVSASRCMVSLMTTNGLQIRLL